VAVILAALLWGTTGTAATFAPGVGPLAIGAAALGIAGILHAAIALPAIGRERVALFRQWPVVVVGAVSVAVYPLAFYSSMHAAGVAIGSVVSLASAPLASGVLEHVVDGRPLGGRWMLAAAAGVLGSTLLCLSRGSGSGASPSVTLVGVGLGLVAGATYAIYSWAAHRLMRTGVSRPASMGAVFGAGGLLLMPVLALTGAPLLATPQTLAVGAYMVLVPMFVGYLCFGYGLSRTRASTATTLTLLEPAVAALLAVIVVGERLSTAGWAGLAAIGVALVVLTTPGSSFSALRRGTVASARARAR
jgi:DME family drug/metabolite transporter